MRKLGNWLLISLLSLSAPALAATRPVARDATRDDVRVKQAKITGFRGVGHVRDVMPEQLEALAAKGTPLREILFGADGKMTSESFRQQQQKGAGDCYSQSTRAALAKLAPERVEQKFVGLEVKGGELVAVDLQKHPDFVPPLKSDGAFDVGVVTYKAGASHDPYIRVVTSRFPADSDGQLAMASLRDDAWWAIFAEQARANSKGSWSAYANGGNAAREMEAETGQPAVTRNIKLTGEPKADAKLTEQVWSDLKTASDEGRVIVAGTAYKGALVRRLKKQVSAGQRTPQAARETWDSTHMIEGHAQSVFHVAEDPVLETNDDGRLKLKNGKPVVATGEDGRPLMERWVYIRNPWGSTVRKGQQVIDPNTGRNEGVYRVSLKDAVGFFDQYYIGGNPKEMKKVGVGKLEIVKD